MGLPKKFMLGLVRGLEKQGAISRRGPGGGWVVKNPETGATLSVHSSPGRSSTEDRYRRDVDRIGYVWPRKLHL